MSTNYQLLLDKELEQIKASGTVPRLLLQSCCGPCSSYVLEYLTEYFKVTVLYYNPNIWPLAEFDKRYGEQMRIIREMTFPNSVDIIPRAYEPSEFYEAANGLYEEREGGARCTECFRLRLFETARIAAENKYDYFATTLTVSPHKNARLLNELGSEASLRYGVKYLFSDFKKRDGYKRSLELSKLYGLYRQTYCGCEFSFRDGAERRS